VTTVYQAGGKLFREGLKAAISGRDASRPDYGNLHAVCELSPGQSFAATGPAQMASAPACSQERTQTNSPGIHP
jgi:hypothetical protein